MQHTDAQLINFPGSLAGLSGMAGNVNSKKEVRHRLLMCCIPRECPSTLLSFSVGAVSGQADARFHCGQNWTVADGACSNCRARKIRCGRERPRCSSCYRDEVECVYLSPPKRVNHVKLLYVKVRARPRKPEQATRLTRHAMFKMPELRQHTGSSDPGARRCLGPHDYVQEGQHR